MEKADLVKYKLSRIELLILYWVNYVQKKVALVFASRSDSENINRVSPLITELEKEGIQAKLVWYSDDTCSECETTLSAFDLVMVWVNPIHEDHDRSVLDAMLRRIARKGVKTFTHPDTILKMGTKDILFQTQIMDWGSDVQRYISFKDFDTLFLDSLKTGIRVLKQYRGNGGDGVWKVELIQEFPPRVDVLHAKRGSVNQQMPLTNFKELMKDYFVQNGHLIDQPYQERLADGMIRCYMSLNRVIGFGHQYVTALQTPQNNEPLIPPPRYYHSNDKKDFQELRRLLEENWISEMQSLLDIPTENLPLLWDADFLLGPKDSEDKDTYVLCETNVSSVYPYPETGNPDIVDMVKIILS